MYLKFLCNPSSTDRRLLTQTLRIMKLSAFLIFLLSFHIYARGYAQNISLTEKNAPLEKVFTQIERQSGYQFWYDQQLVAGAAPVDISVRNVPLVDALNALFRGRPLTYAIIRKTIVVKQARFVNELAAIPPAPTVDIRGRVTDNDGNPLPGASVTVKGARIGAVTDVNGFFELKNIDKQATLSISFTGYVSQEIPVKNTTFFDIMLTPAKNDLNDVVVVGYGTSRRKDLTGSVASVDVAVQEKTPVLGAEQMLEGRVSGVQVSQNQSQPGALFAVRIRGTNSINSSSAPLFVVDGYAGADISMLNPSDILSMDILKDASATAIYGSRGANGVVLITTKRGSGNAPRVAVDAYTGWQTVAKPYKMMNAAQFGDYLNTIQQEQNDLNGVNNPLPYTPAQIASFGAGTDWQKAIFSTAPISNYSIAFSRNSAEGRHYLSFNFFNQKGIITGSDYKRGVIRYNLDQNLGSRLKIGMSSQISYAYQNMTTVNTSGGADQPSVLWDAIRFNPVLPIKDSTGVFTYANGPSGYVLPLGNPVAFISEAKQGGYALNVFANFFAEYEIIKGLKLRSSVGGNYNINGMELFVPTDIFASAGIGSASQTANRYYNLLNENVLTYDRILNEHNVINATGGFTVQHWYNKSFNAGVSNLSTNALGVNNFGVGIAVPPGSFFLENLLMSYFGRLNYRLMDRFLFTATMRADGSSRFGSSHKWGYFPSGAFAWNIGQENFLKSSRLVSELKLRASYGVTGNQEIGSYNSLSQYVTTSYPLGMTPASAVGFIPNNIANPDLKWESTASLNVGADLGLWNNRVSITTDFYAKKTSNLLLFINIPLTSGYTSYLANIGKVSNKGFEFAVTSYNIVRPKFKWSATLNFSTNINRVLNLGSNNQIFVGDLSGSVFNGAGGTSAILLPGHPIGSFYGYVFDGIWQSDAQIANSGTQQAVSPGDPIYRDLNGDSLINGDDRQIIGQALPKLIYGLSNNFTIGRFNVNIFLQGIWGNKIFNENLYEMQNGTPGFNKLAYVSTESWHGEGTSNTLPRVSSILRNAVGVTSDVLENGSFLRVKTVSLSYDLPLPEASRMFKTASVYVTAQNLYTFTKYSGYDPEVNSFTEDNQLSLGTDYNAYPNYRTFLLGVKLGF